VRVLGALMRLKEASDQTRIAWTKFLYSDARRADKPTLKILIARRLASVPVPVLTQVVQPASSWLDNAAKQLYEKEAGTVMALLDRLIEALAAMPQSVENPGVRERDWSSSAWNSAVGNLMRALLADPALVDVALDTSLPSEWKVRAEQLLGLSDDHRRFCLVHLARHLAWLFARDPTWTETVVLSSMERAGEDRDAALAGFFSNANIHGALFARMKPLVLSLSSEEDRSRQLYEAQLASLCITAWCQKNEAGERLLSDEELRGVLVHCSIPMRTRILWQARQFPFAEKLHLLKDVWPLQLVARSPIVTGRLCAMAFEDGEHFPELVDAILPLVSQDNAVGIMFLPDGAIQLVLKRHPEHVLTLLWSVLPLNYSGWPHGIKRVLHQLGKQSARIRKDARMRDLMRRIGVG
jgi:hypothetical protein